MSSTARTLLDIFLFLICTAIFTGAAYEICTYSESSTLANASKMDLTTWSDAFFVVVMRSCVFTAACLMLWYILAKFIFSVSSSGDWGRRTIWFFLFLVVAVGVLVIANVLPDIKINLFVSVVFFICFAVGGYWFTSILITPSRFKTTPLGAELFRH